MQRLPSFGVEYWTHPFGLGQDIDVVVCNPPLLQGTQK